MAREQCSRILHVCTAFEGRFRQVTQLSSNVDQETKCLREPPVRRIQPNVSKEQTFRSQEVKSHQCSAKGVYVMKEENRNQNCSCRRSDGSFPGLFRADGCLLYTSDAADE